METLNSVLRDIEHIKKSHELLEQVCSYLDPYGREINGVEVGGLIRIIHEHLYDFNDDE